MNRWPFKLFEKYGIELEYMVVDKISLQVKPIVDQLFLKLSGQVEEEVKGQEINLSNELVSHVVELKNARPEENILAQQLPFQSKILEVQDALEEFDCILLPTAMHPWMDPEKETQLWPYGNRDIYNAYDKIFSCQGHGWANLQSMHINISFGSDEEFALLNSAIRAILPLIPILSSSSPLVEGKLTQFHSSRLTYYLENQARVPSIIGDVIPPTVSSEKDFTAKVLQPMYSDIAPFDPEKLLQEEWLNSRGAIPKFKYGCMEIRLADLQETPSMDLQLAAFWTTLLQTFAKKSWGDIEAMDRISSANCKLVFLETIKNGENAVIRDLDYLHAFGVNQACTGRDLIHHIYETISKFTPSLDTPAILWILQHGSLSSRIIESLGGNTSREAVSWVYRELSQCLVRGDAFAP